VVVPGCRDKLNLKDYSNYGIVNELCLGKAFGYKRVQKIKVEKSLE
jgi:hypothetical protein